ncbi:MAG: 50S ribosomal protein L18 [Flavobacteriaceae bacterium]|nr:50S ribosomal protein L18 [Flavobacteriaceae bacterium]MCY4216341.1 50S ribosomal protein L18 [Flavobacteriaceae bacterium]MCY4253291.1 50S ribosomal protein L18 [Flavobacteriaceae bacterium]
MSTLKTFKRNRIRRRIRGVVKGTSERPRLSVFRSNRQIYAQLIDDEKGSTLTAASSRDSDFESKKLTGVALAKQVGILLANRAKEAKIKSVHFDRGGYRYHGRVKSLAEGAREGGLKF